MCDTDQQCQSPLAVTPVPLKACKTPHISHITSLKSFILPSVLCDLTQWLFMPRDPACVCVRARSCVQGQVQIGPLLHDNRSISVPLAHLCLPFLLQFVFFQHSTVERSALTALIHLFHLFSLLNPTANYLMLHTSGCFSVLVAVISVILSSSFLFFYFFIFYFYKIFCVFKMVFSR